MFNELQKKVKEYDARFGWTEDALQETALHMSEELGEISRELLRASGYKGDTLDKEALGDEIADLLYLTIKLGNLTGLDLSKSWERIEKRYESK